MMAPRRQQFRGESVVAKETKDRVSGEGTSSAVRKKVEPSFEARAIIPTF